MSRDPGYGHQKRIPFGRRRRFESHIAPHHIAGIQARRGAMPCDAIRCEGPPTARGPVSGRRRLYLRHLIWCRIPGVSNSFQDRSASVEGS